jgi:hypothetical protein
MAENSRLTNRQRRALDHFLTCGTIREVSQASGVPERTLYTWLHDDTFREALAERRRIATGQALQIIGEHIGLAVNTLRRLTLAESEAVQRSAATDILNFALKVQQAQDVDERLTRIEAALEKMEDAEK